MENTLRNLCAAHDLTCISVMLQVNFGDHVTAYLHFNLDGETRCASGSGKTFEGAFAKGLAEASTMRSDASMTITDRIAQ